VDGLRALQARRETLGEQAKRLAEAVVLHDEDITNISNRGAAVHRFKSDRRTKSVNRSKEGF
jgi:hypothetical protein